jgi:hypothetical protein
MPLDKHGGVTLSADALAALLGRMQPKQLADAVKAKAGQPTADIIATMLQAVGITQQQVSGSRRASASGAAATAAGSSSGGGSGSMRTEVPYFNFNPIDMSGLEVHQQQQGGAGSSGGGGGSNGGSSGVAGASLSEADAAVSQLLGDIRDSVRPSEYTAAAWKVARRHVKKLHKSARRAKKAGKAGDAAACRWA